MKDYEAKILDKGTAKERVLISKEFSESLKDAIVLDVLKIINLSNRGIYFRLKEIQKEIKRLTIGGVSHGPKIQALRVEFNQVLESLNEPIAIEF